MTAEGSRIRWPGLLKDNSRLRNIDIRLEVHRTVYDTLFVLHSSSRVLQTLTITPIVELES